MTAKNIAQPSTLLLIGIALADFLAAVDSTAVYLALPKIASDLQIAGSGVSLINILYTFALVAALIPAGKLGDKIGHKRVFMIGLALFGGASLILTLAPTFATLLILRFVQGLGGAMLFTGGGGLIAHHWENTEKAFATTGAVFGLGMLVGPLLGGILTDLTLGSFQGWHLIFAINLPIVVISAFLLKRYAQETTQNLAIKFQFFGLLFLIISLGLLVTLFMQDQYRSLLLIGLIMSAWFFILLERKNAHPLFELKLFQQTSFSAIALFTLVCMLVLNGLSYINSFYLQDVLGNTAYKAGLMMLPISLGMAVFSGIAGVNKNWKRGALIAASLILLGLIYLSFVQPSTPYWAGLLPGYILVSAGAGFMITTTFAAGLGSIGKQFSGLGAGYLNTAQQIGALAGVAFVAQLDVIQNYSQIYLYLTFIAIIALVAAGFVKTNQAAHE